MIKPWPWVALLILIAALTGFHVYDKNTAVKAAIVATTATLNNEYQSKLNKTIKEAATVTDKLKTDASKSQELKDAEIKKLASSLSAATSRLSNRPKRQPAPVTPNTPSIVNSCTGAELYREDGEFLTREAYRAESLITERDYYYNQYENARKELEGLKAK
jgi:hypothetical protein